MILSHAFLLDPYFIIVLFVYKPVVVGTPQFSFAIDYSYFEILDSLPYIHGTRLLYTESLLNTVRKSFKGIISSPINKFHLEFAIQNTLSDHK